MSGEIPKNPEDININAFSHYHKALELLFNKHQKAGVFDLQEAHMAFTCLTAFSETIKRCDILQKKLGHIIRQQEEIQKLEQ